MTTYALPRESPASSPAELALPVATAPPLTGARRRQKVVGVSGEAEHLAERHEPGREAITEAW